MRGLPEIPPEREIGDLPRDKRVSDASGQANRDKNFEAFFEMTSRGFGASRREYLNRHWNEGRGDADRRNDQRLTHEIEARAKVSGGGAAGKFGEQEPIRHAGDRQQR